MISDELKAVVGDRNIVLIGNPPAGMYPVGFSQGWWAYHNELLKLRDGQGSPQLDALSAAGGVRRDGGERG